MAAVAGDGVLQLLVGRGADRGAQHRERLAIPSPVMPGLQATS